MSPLACVGVLYCVAVSCSVLQSSVCRLFTMGWLRLVGSLKLWVSFAEYSLFYRALFQKRSIILRSLLTVVTPLVATICRLPKLSSSPYKQTKWKLRARVCVCVETMRARVCACVCVRQRKVSGFLCKRTLFS